ncbi:YncE family protein, partial [Rhodococcus sp. IEGM 1379]|nr:YncE family protein [Rhodococcus sp. IEGM 1379]
MATMYRSTSQTRRSRLLAGIGAAAIALTTLAAGAGPASADTVTATIPVGTTPFSVAITPDGARAYITNYDSASVSVIETATNTATGTIP